MEIVHVPQIRRFETIVDGYTAYTEYTINDGVLDIIHTIVPKPISGQGIASKLVEETYKYADEMGYKRAGSCSYAKIWLERHPQ